MMHFYKRTQSGFTLIEVIIVIVITGLLGALVASFAAPLKGYFDALNRAELSDVADTALRRMARELRAALPNSVRVSGSAIEFLPTLTGGRYRGSPAPSGTPLCNDTLDILDFTLADSCFEVIGGLPTSTSIPIPVAGNELVVYNADPSYVYQGLNVATIVPGSTANIIMFSSKQFPQPSPKQRFQIIDKPVTFICDTATLWRYSGYSRQATQPDSIAKLNVLSGITVSRLATGVSCNNNFVYTAGITAHDGLVLMRLTLANSSDSVTLLHQVHVQNVP